MEFCLHLDYAPLRCDANLRKKFVIYNDSDILKGIRMFVCEVCVSVCSCFQNFTRDEKSADNVRNYWAHFILLGRCLHTCNMLHYS